MAADRNYVAAIWAKAFRKFGVFTLLGGKRSKRSVSCLRLSPLRFLFHPSGVISMQLGSAVAKIACLGN